MTCVVRIASSQLRYPGSHQPIEVTGRKPRADLCDRVREDSRQALKSISVFLLRLTGATGVAAISPIAEMSRDQIHNEQFSSFQLAGGRRATRERRAGAGNHVRDYRNSASFLNFHCRSN